MRKMLVRFSNDDSGATAIEYGLIAAGIALAIMAGVEAVGGGLTETFQNIAAALGGGETPT